MALRRLAAAVFVITALLLQVTIVNRLGLPAGEPNLVIAVVIALVLVEGPAPGMVYAFLAGFLADLLSTHTVGRLALVWSVVAYLAGFVAPEDRGGERALALPIVSIAVLSAVATGGYVALDVVTGSPHEAVSRIVEQIAGVLVWGFVLAPFVYLFVRTLLRRLQSVTA